MDAGRVSNVNPCIDQGCIGYTKCTDIKEKGNQLWCHWWGKWGSLKVLVDHNCCHGGWPPKFSLPGESYGISVLFLSGPIYTVESGFWEKIGVQGPFPSVPSRTWISEQYAASVWFGPTGPWPQSHYWDYAVQGDHHAEDSLPGQPRSGWNLILSTAAIILKHEKWREMPVKRSFG